MKPVVSTLLVTIGSATVTTLVWLSLAQASGADLNRLFPLQLLAVLAGTAVVCLCLGALLWDRWNVALGEVWIVLGSFLLGVASRSAGVEAELLGLSGLFSFTVGYLVLKRASTRQATHEKASPEERERALTRMLEDPLNMGDRDRQGSLDLNTTLLGGFSAEQH